MKYIAIPLAVIVALFLFGLFHDGSSATYQRIPLLNGSYTQEATNGTLTESGSEISLGSEESEYSFSMNTTQGILAVIIAVSIIASLIGINVLGSGLSETTVKILYNTIFFYGIWGLFSVYALEKLLLIPVGGWIIYALLTGAYSLGINKRING